MLVVAVIISVERITAQHGLHLTGRDAVAGGVEAQLSGLLRDNAHQPRQRYPLQKHGQVPVEHCLAAFGLLLLPDSLLNRGRYLAFPVFL